MSQHLLYTSYRTHFLPPRLHLERSVRAMKSFSVTSSPKKTADQAVGAHCRSGRCWHRSGNEYMSTWIQGCQIKFRFEDILVQPSKLIIMGLWLWVVTTFAVINFWGRQVAPACAPCCASVLKTSRRSFISSLLHNRAIHIFCSIVIVLLDRFYQNLSKALGGLSSTTW